MSKYMIRGTVRLQETGLALAGLVVKAYDDDLVFDDLLGDAVTDGAGRFEIAIDTDDGREPLDGQPDLYFKVLSPDRARVLHKSATRRCNIDGDRPIEILISQAKLGDGDVDAAPRIAMIGADDRDPRDTYDPGEPLTVTADGLAPLSPHDVVVRAEDGRALLTDRLITDAHGRIPPTVVWAQLGLDDPREREPITVDEARRRWAGRALTVELRHGKRTVAASTARVASAFERPLALATDDRGAVVNGFEVGTRDAVVSLYGLPTGPRDGVRVYMVPRQHDWRVGDPIRPVTLAGGRLAAVDIDLAPDQRDARARVAAADELAPGAYDFIIRPLRYGYEHDHLVLTRADIAGSRLVTGLVVREGFMASKAVRGGCVNTLQIAGRAIAGAPYLQFSDVFQVGEDIYGALDPAALDPALISKMVALYVVPHKSAANWTASGALQHLPVLGGNPGVQTLLTQSFCVNANRRLLWPGAAQVGTYDIVADFGDNTGDPAAFTPDASYDTPLDIIDGYFVPGFRVVPDPAVDTQFAHAGAAHYTEATDGAITVTDDYGTSATVNVRARVYFPADIPGATGPSQISASQPSYPLVVIAHGNSGATNSYEGYDYLLQHLARNGFIAASVHQNPGMLATGRARVLLHHIALLKAKFGAKAANNVGVMGHSRGGEAVVIAARLNYQDSLGHDINAVISLAPTDWIAGPTLGGAWAAPYLVVYGSMDGDVAGVGDTGFELYDRAGGHDKSMVFVYGSAHGRYNTVWGDTDITASWSSLGPTDIPKLINADAHQQIARGYMTAFFRRHLKGEAQWDGIFKGEWVPAAVQQADAGKVRLYVQYEGTGGRTVDTFEGAHTPTSWQTSTIGGAVTQSGLAATPQEVELAAADAHSPHATAGLTVQWNNIGDRVDFAIPAGQRDVTAYAAVSFRIGQKVGSAFNPADQAQDLRLILRDTAGQSRAVRVSKFAQVPYPHTRHNAALTKSALCTVRIPLTAFTIRCAGVPEVDLTAVEGLALEFGEKPTGEVAIDTVAFTH